MAKDVKEKTKKSSTKKETVKTKAKEVKKDITEKIEDIKENIEDKVEDIKDKVEDFGDKIEDFGDELEDKIEDKIDDVKDKIKEAKKQPKIKKTINFIKDNKVIILVVIIAILSIIIYGLVAPSKGDRLILSATNTLKSIQKKEDVNLVEYTYNAVATKKDGKKVQYYVAYEGKVKAGIDFEKVGIRINENKKTIIISIPTPKITSFTIVDNKFEYIFTKDKYQTEGMKNAIYDLCEKDLEKRIEKDTLLLETAKDNAITTMKSFYEPWLETMAEDYKLEVEIMEGE